MKLILLLTFYIVVPVFGSQILVLTPFGSVSVRSVFNVVCEELLTRGHNVTLISSGEPFPKHENLTHVKSPHFAFDITNLFEARQGFEIFKAWKKALPKAAEEFYSDENVMSVWNGRHKFDAVIINSAANEMALPFVLNTTVPYITLQPVGIDPLQLVYLGNLVSPATLPSIILPYSAHMNFWERMVNFVTLALLKYSYYRSIEMPLNKVLKEFFPNLPSPSDVYQHQSLALYNSHYLLDGPVPLLPNQVEVGCLSCRDAQTVFDEEIASFLESSGDSVIFFALGSLQNPEEIPQKYVDILLEAFGRLTRYKILAQLVVKDEATVPSNVLLSKWLPQQDILGHPNVVLFLSHCGRQSVSQALYHGVPVLGLPIAFDQNRNCQRLKKQGAALVLEWNDLTVDVVTDAINNMIDNKKFTEHVKNVSQRLQAQKETGLERAVWHIEYTISQGDVLSRYSGQHMNLWQYLLLDVIIVLIAVILIVLSCLYFTVKKLYHRNCKEKLKQL